MYLYDITDFKTATSQQKDALANTREDPYSKKSKELQTHLQCDDHPGKFCFKASNIRGVSRPSDHVQLDAVAIRDWATAILNDSATLTCPPRTPEFEDILSNTRSRSKTPRTFNLNGRRLHPLLLRSSCSNLIEMALSNPQHGLPVLHVLQQDVDLLIRCLFRRH